jgi:hypothetical protein
VYAALLREAFLPTFAVTHQVIGLLTVSVLVKAVF